MTQKRRNHSPNFKAKVALAAVKGEETTAQLSSRFGVHQVMIRSWKKILMTEASALFEGKGSRFEEPM